MKESSYDAYDVSFLLMAGMLISYTIGVIDARETTIRQLKAMK